MQVLSRFLGTTSEPAMESIMNYSIEPQIEEHNLRPAAVWNSGGAAYDEISRSVADAIEHCVSRLAPQVGEKILDVATGTGWTARRIARYGAKVTGVDLGADLIAAAKRLAEEQELRLDFRVGDAERLPYSDGEFDAVVSTFGVMFATRPEQAAAELARVCRNGGRLAMATWLSDSSIFQMFMVMKPYLPAVSSPPPSPFEWGRPERVRELLGRDFDLRFEQGKSQLHVSDGGAAWQMFEAGYGPTRSLAAGLDEQRRQQLERDFIAFHDRFRTELGVTMPRDYLVTIGVRR
jgi:SAM-dependent methyltransferase